MFIVFLIVIALINVDVFAEDDAGSRASFTRGGWAGAKYIAMGKAAEAVVDDVYSIYWNPAGLRELLEKENLTPEEIKNRAERGELESITEDDLVNFSEEDYTKSFVLIGASLALLDIEREAGFMGVAFNMFGGVVGFGLYSIQSRDIESRDEAGNYIADIDYTASAGYISYGWASGVASFGLTVKGLNEKIGDYGYYGCGIDIGAQIELIPFLKLGFIIQDVRTGLKPYEDYRNIENKYDFASPVIKLSAAITNRASDFVISFTSIKKLEQEEYEFNFGFQYNILKYSSLYFGLNDSLLSSGISFNIFGVEATYAFSFDRIDSGYNNIVSMTFAL